MSLPDRIQAAGISIHSEFEPGDLGQLVFIHGVQNHADYGFNAIHEAYCGQIAVEYVLDRKKGRSRAWLAKQADRIVGSVLIIERPGNQAQLRLLFVDRSVRGLGLGRWLVEESIRYCRSVEFNVVYLWTVDGLDRAISVYESVGFVKVAQKPIDDWGGENLEIQFDLDLSSRVSP